MKRFLSLLFMPCEGVAERLSLSQDQELTRSERIAVRTHLWYCRACRRYRAQLHVMRQAMARLRDDTCEGSEDHRLGDRARARILNQLKQD